MQKIDKAWMFAYPWGLVSKFATENRNFGIMWLHAVL